MFESSRPVLECHKPRATQPIAWGLQPALRSTNPEPVGKTLLSRRVRIAASSLDSNDAIDEPKLVLEYIFAPVGRELNKRGCSEVFRCRDDEGSAIHDPHEVLRELQGRPVPSDRAAFEI